MARSFPGRRGAEGDGGGYLWILVALALTSAGALIAKITMRQRPLQGTAAKAQVEDVKELKQFDL